jgi:hypothetical protein
VVEGARLESVYRGNSIQGSNPCLSAILESITYRLSFETMGNGGEYCGRLPHDEPQPLPPSSPHRKRLRRQASPGLSVVRKRRAAAEVAQMRLSYLCVWRLGDNLKFRKNTGQFTWDAAKTVAADWEGGAAPVAPAPIVPTGPQEKKPVLIPDAMKAYIADHETSGSAYNTIKKNKEVCAKMQRFCDAKGVRAVREFDQAMVRDLITSWPVSQLTREKQHGLVKVFFEFCVECGWIEKNPARFKRRRNRENKTGTTTRRQHPVHGRRAAVDVRCVRADRQDGNPRVAQEKERPAGRCDIDLSRVQPEVNRPGSRGFRLAIDVHRYADIGRVHISYLAAESERGCPRANDEGRRRRFDLGARLAPGAHSCASKVGRSADLRHAHH